MRTFAAYQSSRVPRPNVRKVEVVPVKAEKLLFEVRELQSKLKEQQELNRTLKEENRTVSRMVKLQEKELKRNDVKQANAPAMADAVFEDLRVVKNQLKTTQEKLAISDKALKDLHEIYTKQKERNQQLQAMVKKNHIDDSETLKKQLEKAKSELKEKDYRISELEDIIEEQNSRIEKLRLKLNNEPIPSKQQSGSARKRNKEAVVVAQQDSLKPVLRPSFDAPGASD